jgi:AcrR family transcriptional regulator
MEVFWAQGYEGTTLEDLQSAMGGIAAPSFYHAFGSKQDLFREVVEQYRVRADERIAAVMADRAKTRAAIEAMLSEAAKAYCDPESPRGCLLVLGAMNCARSAKDAHDHLLSLRQRAPKMIRQRFERGVSAGDLSADVDLSALVAFYAAVLNGMAIRARDGASHRELMTVVRGAMAAWKELTSPPRSRTRKGTQRA